MDSRSVESFGKYKILSEIGKGGMGEEYLAEEVCGSPSSLYPFGRLGKARATKDKKEYEKFFEMWKDAEKDLPALIAAKKEYAELD